MLALYPGPLKLLPTLVEIINDGEEDNVLRGPKFWLEFGAGSRTTPSVHGTVAKNDKNGHAPW